LFWPPPNFSLQLKQSPSWRRSSILDIDRHLTGRPSTMTVVAAAVAAGAGAGRARCGGGQCFQVVRLIAINRPGRSGVLD
jgi:hypothetical protein